MVDYWLIFVTGLTTGGLTCLAVQGGLLTTALVKQVSVKDKGSHKTVTGLQLPPNPLPVVYFLVAKLVAHTLLGFCLGLLGSALQLSPAVQAAIQILVGLFMLATALNMLNVHPVFRYVVIQPPKAWTRLVRQRSKNADAFTPVLLGLLTVLIPCGTTQAMETLAIASGGPFIGALIMAIFVLGSSPTFFVLGFLATQLRGKMQSALSFAAAFLILALSFISINSGLMLLGSPLAPGYFIPALIQSTRTPVPAQLIENEGIQEIVINVHDESYSPDYFSAESGVPLRLRLRTNKLWGCTAIFVMVGHGIREFLPETGETVINLPAQPPGTLHFSCGMGMYGGSIVVS